MLLPGQRVNPWGEIGAVGCIHGERYYWLIDCHGTVSMMPADVVEARATGEADTPAEDGKK